MYRIKEYINTIKLIQLTVIQIAIFSLFKFYFPIIQRKQRPFPLYGAHRDIWIEIDKNRHIIFIYWINCFQVWIAEFLDYAYRLVRKLDLFPSSCEKMGRHLLFWVRSVIGLESSDWDKLFLTVQWLRLALFNGPVMRLALSNGPVIGSSFF
jgi:hypothetical protein